MSGRERCYLEDVWRSWGTPRLRRLFSELTVRDSSQALEYLNDEKLGFPVFFLLLSDVCAWRLTGGLSERNKAALTICGRKLVLPCEAGAAWEQDWEVYRRSLTWIVRTGKDWDGPERERDSYDAIIDYAASLLIIHEDDKLLLPDIAELIFRRNRQGLLIHDLAWTFYQTLDADAMALIAGYLLSADPKDVTLAGELLCLDIPEPADQEDLRQLHQEYLVWIRENRPYLYLTGEHFQMTSQPKPFAVDREAKYLGKEISPRYCAPLEPLTDTEWICLHRYRASVQEEQEALAEYSHALRSRDWGQWEAWMQKQPAEQVLAARLDREVI